MPKLTVQSDETVRTIVLVPSVLTTVRFDEYFDIDADYEVVRYIVEIDPTVTRAVIVGRKLSKAGRYLSHETTVYNEAVTDGILAYVKENLLP